LKGAAEMDKKTRTKKPKASGGTASIRSESSDTEKNSPASSESHAALFGLNLDISTARNAIILSEIIGPPVSKRQGQRRR